MNKLFLQGVVLLALLFGSLFALSQIDWINNLKIEDRATSTEEKLGNLLWEFYQHSGQINSDPIKNSILDSIVTQICAANAIERTSIKIHLLDNSEVNAFAMPGGHIIVYSGLMNNVDNQNELIGVICHELAHIELNHVMKKLLSEIGLSTLLTMTTGNTGSDMIKNTANVLTTSSFDRKLEKEADIKSVDYMIKANIDPEPFATFLYKLSLTKMDHIASLQWIQSHPGSEERSAYIIEYIQGNTSQYQTIIPDSVWNKMSIADGQK